MYQIGDIIERAGIKYKCVDTEPAWLIKSQGAGFLSRAHVTSKRDEVGPLATRVLSKHATILTVGDLSWISQDGDCRALTVSVYMRRDGKWAHFSGKRITHLDEIIAKASALRAEYGEETGNGVDDAAGMIVKFGTVARAMEKLTSAS